MKVFLIGSCRIHQTLAPLLEKIDYDDGGITMFSYKFIYPHSTREIVQYLMLLRGQITVPDTTLKYIAHSSNLMTPNKIKEAYLRLVESDTVIIEISSSKMQIDHQKGQKFFYNIVEVERYKSSKLYPPKVMANEAIRNDINMISELLRDKKILFVTHIKNNSVSRTELIDLIYNSSQKLGHYCFRPNEHIKHDRLRCLTDDNHYSPMGMNLIKQATINKLKTIRQINFKKEEGENRSKQIDSICQTKKSDQSKIEDQIKEKNEPSKDNNQIKEKNESSKENNQIKEKNESSKDNNQIKKNDTPKDNHQTKKCDTMKDNSQIKKNDTLKDNPQIKKDILKNNTKINNRTENYHQKEVENDDTIDHILPKKRGHLRLGVSPVIRIEPLCSSITIIK